MNNVSTSEILKEVAAKCKNNLDFQSHKIIFENNGPIIFPDYYGDFIKNYFDEYLKEVK